MKSIHKFSSYADCRSQGQTEYEYAHQTKCGYVRDLVTDIDNEVTCKLCLREIKKDSNK